MVCKTRNVRACPYVWEAPSWHFLCGGAGSACAGLDCLSDDDDDNGCVCVCVRVLLTEHMACLPPAKACVVFCLLHTIVVVAVVVVRRAFAKLDHFAGHSIVDVDVFFCECECVWCAFVGR